MSFQRFFRHALVPTMLACCAVANASAAGYPDRAIKIVVGYPPGGTTDLIARALAKELTASLKQPVVVENRAGAGGNVGAAAVAKADPDGYTLGVGTAGNLALNYVSYKNIPYDSLEDFTNLSVLASVPNVLVVNSKTPIKNVGDLTKSIQAKKDGGFFGSTGTGNGPHLTGELFKAKTGLKLTHVPYQGSAPAATALLGGEVDMGFDNLSGVLALIQSDKLRAIAVTSAARSPVLPDVPTLAEQGIKDFDVKAWFALFGPAHMNKDVSQKIEQAVAALKQNAAFTGLLKQMGTTPELTDGAALQQLIAKERSTWPAVVKEAGVKIE